MKILGTWGISIALCLYAILHYITYFYPSDLLMLLLSISGILFILLFAVHSHVKQFAVPLCLILSSIIIQLVTDGSIVNMFMEGILQLREIIALLLIVPIASWVFREEQYVEKIMNVAHTILNTSSRFYFGLMLINQIISYFLLISSIPMLYQLINGFLGDKKSEAWENYKSTALLRSHALSTLWVISIPSFIFAVDHLDASLGLTVLQGFVISTCGIFLSVAFLYFQKRRYGEDITVGIRDQIEKILQKSKEDENQNRVILEFILLFIYLFSAIIFLHIVIGIELLVAIPPVIVVWTCIYFLIKKKKDRFKDQCKEYFIYGIRKQSQQLSLLLAAGLFVFSINNSGLSDYIIEAMLYITTLSPLINFLAIIPLVVMGLGFVGLGPLTVLVLVASIIGKVSLPYPSELVVLSMTSGSVISVILSPVVTAVMVLSSINGLSVWKNGFIFNIGYAIVFYCFVQIYIQIMLHFVY